ncbi:protocatechuate 3,4-dioxygenase beta subunit [Burkholderiales bacterium JOSHI_001]|nr:protocatechuate 3,4-dioxygenase beta subunit [Burkholderiales bacterium JOSHI_001]
MPSLSRKPLARRRLLHSGLALAGAAVLGAPALASSRRSLPAMTEGPFYPPRAWREAWPDWDADLTRVQRRDGSTLTARGDALGLALRVVDTRDRLIDGAEVEIWQCDALAQYRHPSVQRSIDTATGFDPGFQGFGSARSDAQGALRFRTIRPVAYPGRTPHIHVLLRHASFGSVVSQLFVAGDPGNARDFLWRGLREDERSALALDLKPAAPDSGLAYSAQHLLVVPA